MPQPRKSATPETAAAPAAITIATELGLPLSTVLTMRWRDVVRPRRQRRQLDLSPQLVDELRQWRARAAR